MDRTSADSSHASRADSLIGGFDRMLRTLAGTHSAAEQPGSPVSNEGELGPDERKLSAALMRVNHAGEVCAQALYQGQALFARDGSTRELMERASQEESTHLAWTRERLRELGDRTSVLDPLWYLSSFAIGVVAGALGDRRSLGFLAETERQVERHLSGHLARLPPGDLRSRAVVETMREDESRHRAAAEALGAADIPEPGRFAMKCMARVMTTVSHYL
jgi:ubiquinone biosynthesis monooxygenase Coq7